MRVDLEGRRGGAELGGTEVEKTLVRTYCVRKESIFIKRKMQFVATN